MPSDGTAAKHSQGLIGVPAARASAYGVARFGSAHRTDVVVGIHQVSKARFAYLVMASVRCNNTNFFTVQRFEMGETDRAVVIICAQCAFFFGLRSLSGRSVSSLFVVCADGVHRHMLASRMVIEAFKGFFHGARLAACEHTKHRITQCSVEWRVQSVRWIGGYFLTIDKAHSLQFP